MQATPQPVITDNDLTPEELINIAKEVAHKNNNEIFYAISLLRDHPFLEEIIGKSGLNGKLAILKQTFSKSEMSDMKPEYSDKTHILDNELGDSNQEEYSLYIKKLYAVTGGQITEVESTLGEHFEENGTVDYFVSVDIKDISINTIDHGDLVSNERDTSILIYNTGRASNKAQ